MLLSTHAPILVSFSRFASPIPGTGTKVMMIQYRTSMPPVIRTMFFSEFLRKIMLEIRNTSAILCSTPGMRTVLKAAMGSVKIFG